MNERASEAERLLRELWEAVQAPLDWQNGNDMVADFAEVEPTAYKRVCDALIAVQAFLERENG